MASTHDSETRQRRALRPRDHDYARAGAYFVTLCAVARRCLFGEVVEGEMRLNAWGRIVQTCLDELPAHYPNLTLDVAVVMPNHVHAIFMLSGDPRVVGAGLKPAPTDLATATDDPSLGTHARVHGLPEIVRALKTFSARQINHDRGTPGATVWQRNYYDHIIRNEAELDRARGYIATNPARWSRDPENPAASDPERAALYRGAQCA